MDHPEEFEAERVAIAELASQVLADGPLPLDEMVKRMIETEHAAQSDLVALAAEAGIDGVALFVGDLLTDSDDFWQTDPTDMFEPALGELMARMDLLIASRVFTTRVSALDITTDSLEVGANLCAIEWAIGVNPTVTLNGQPADIRWDDELKRSAIHGPAGWLAGFEPADIASVRFADGNLTIERVDDTTAAFDFDAKPDEASQLAAYANVQDPTVGFAIYRPVLDLLTRDETAFTMLGPPITEALSDAGFSHQGEWFGPAETDWLPPGVRDREDSLNLIAEQHHFDQASIDAFKSVLDDHRNHLFVTTSGSLDDLDVDFRRAAANLAQENVADAFATYLHENGLLDSETTTDFLLTIAATHRVDAAAAHYLLGVQAELEADHEAADRSYRAALVADPHYPLPLIKLAWVLFDQGDYQSSREHLLRAGVPADADVFALFPATDDTATTDPQAAEFASARRNDPCPCGSGRKYKVCHAQASGAPATTSDAWHELDRKETRHRAMSLDTNPTITLAITAAEADMDRIETLVHDSVIYDLARHEYGGLQDMVKTRGALLPAAELALAEQLLTTRRDLFEIVGVDPGASLTMSSVTSGETTIVEERVGSLATMVGIYVLTRVLEHDDGICRAYGELLQVPLRARESLLEVLDHTDHGLIDEGHELARWYGQLIGPPTLTTREGEPLELWIAELHVAVPYNDVVATVETFAEPEGDQWHEYYDISGDGTERILRSTLSVHADESGAGTNVRVEVMAMARGRRVIEWLRDAYGEQVHVVSFDMQATGADYLSAGAGLSGSPDDATAVDDDDELAEIARQYVADYEAKWLDESIPLLDGATPREAADDPTRRGDLLKMLDEMPAVPEGEVGMSPDRLRTALGLDE